MNNRIVNFAVKKAVGEEARGACYGPLGVGIFVPLGTVGNINKQFTPPPPPALQTLSNTLHNTVSAVIAVLYSCCPRDLRLAGSVSSRAFFPARRMRKVLYNSH